MGFQHLALLHQGPARDIPKGSNHGQIVFEKI